MAIITNGRNFKSFLFPSDGAIFSDFFDVIEFARNREIYLKEGVQYPPFSLLLMRLVAIIIPGGLNVNVSSYQLRSTQIGMMVFLLIFFISTIILLVCITHYEKDEKYWSLVFVLVTLINIPYILLLTRGNILVISVALSALFVGFYKSDNKIIREISYVSLAIAFNIKITPALLGILLLKRKDFSGAAKTIGYALIIFVFSFIGFSQPIDSIFCFFKNSFSWGGASGDLIKSVDFTTSLRRLFIIIFQSEEVSFCAILSRWIVRIALVFTTIGIILDKNETKVIIALSLIISGFSELSFLYNYCYLIFPLLLFLKIFNHKKMDDIFIAIGFVMVFGLISFPEPFFTLMTIEESGETVVTQIPIMVVGLGATSMFFAYTCRSLFILGQHIICLTERTKRSIKE